MQVGGSLQAALAAVETALADLPPGAPPELRSRARSLEGIILGKLGQSEQALASVREALAEALSAGHPATAAAAYQALAVVYENAGNLGEAAEAYEVAIDYCATTGVAGTGAVCSACLCHVLRQRGEWRRSLALCRSLLEDPSVDEESRAIAAAVMSQIHASRGERRPARLRVLEAAPVSGTSACSAPRWSARGHWRASSCSRARTTRRSSTVATCCGAGRRARTATTA